MSNKKEPTARELEKQADALLAAADAAEKAKNPPIMTDAEQKRPESCGWMTDRKSVV